MAAWAYAPSFRGVFLYDDREAIVENPHIRSLWPLGHALAAPPNTTLASRPFASLTFAVNYALTPPQVRDAWAPREPPGPSGDPFYRNVRGYHLTNLLVHIAAGIVLFGVIRQSLVEGSVPAGLRHARTALSTSAAAVWLVHPLNTESVTYIVQRVESLMALLYLTTLYCALRAVSSRMGRAWTIGAVVACALGMATKETMVTAPMAVAMWLAVLRPASLRAWSGRVLLAGLASTWAILGALVSTGARSESVGFAVGGWTWWSYLRTQCEVILHYLRLAFVPHPLVFEYAWLPASSWSEVLPEATFLVVLSIGTAVALAKRMPMALIPAVCLLVLAPSSSVLPIATEVAAEHRAYLPLAAVVTGTMTGVVWIGQKAIGIGALGATGVSWLRFMAWALVSVTVVTLAAMTRERNLVYHSVDAMVADVVRARPQNAQAQLAHGASMLEARRFSEAETHLRMALHAPLPLGVSGTIPRSLMHMYLGSSLCAQEKYQDGVEHLGRALVLNPELREVHGLLAEAHLAQGQRREAARHLDHAIAALPDLPPLLVRAAWLFATAPEPEIRNGRRAVIYAERAVRLTAGRDFSALDTLAAAYAESARFGDAVRTVTLAIGLAQASDNTAVLSELYAHQRLYEAGRPLRTEGR